MKWNWVSDGIWKYEEASFNFDSFIIYTLVKNALFLPQSSLPGCKNMFVVDGGKTGNSERERNKNNIIYQEFFVFNFENVFMDRVFRKPTHFNVPHSNWREKITVTYHGQCTNIF